MGWVSTLEDITDRLAEDLRSISQAVEKDIAKSAERKRLQELIAESNARIRELAKYVTLAKDPKVQVAKALSEHQELQRQLEDRVVGARARANKAERERQNAELRVEKLKKDVEACQKECQRLGAQLEEIFRKYPKIGYELFKPPSN